MRVYTLIARWADEEGDTRHTVVWRGKAESNDAAVRAFNEELRLDSVSRESDDGADELERGGVFPDGL